MYAKLGEYLKGMQERFYEKLDELRPPETHKRQCVAYAKARQIIVNNMAHYVSLVRYNEEREVEEVVPIKYDGPEPEYFAMVYEKMVKLLATLYYTWQDLRLLTERSGTQIDRCAECGTTCIQRATVCDCGIVMYCSEKCRREHAAWHKLHCAVQQAKRREELEQRKKAREKQKQKAKREEDFAKGLERQRRESEARSAYEKRLARLAAARVRLGQDTSLEEAMAKVRISEPPFTPAPSPDDDDDDAVLVEHPHSTPSTRPPPPATQR